MFTLQPKKHKELINPVAEEMQVNTKLVEDLVNFYWKDVRNTLSKKEAHNLFVAGLGTFRARSWKIPALLEQYNETINRYRKQMESGVIISLQKFSMLKEAETKVARLNGLQKMIDADADKKIKKKKERYEKDSEQNLEG